MPSRRRASSQAWAGCIWNGSADRSRLLGFSARGWGGSLGGLASPKQFPLRGICRRSTEGDFSLHSLRRLDSRTQGEEGSMYLFRAVSEGISPPKASVGRAEKVQALR